MPISFAPKREQILIEVERSDRNEIRLVEKGSAEVLERERMGALESGEVEHGSTRVLEHWRAILQRSGPPAVKRTALLQGLCDWRR